MLPYSHYDQILKNRWIKLSMLLVFFGWLFYLLGNKNPEIPKDLYEMELTLKSEYENADRHSSYKLFFLSKEHSCRFGLKKFGNLDRTDELENLLKPGQKVLVRISRSDYSRLNQSTSTASVYALGSTEKGFLFDEENVYSAERKSNQRFAIFFLIFFAFGLWRIFSN